MSREQAIERAERYFDGGGFFADLSRRVAIKTESQESTSAAELERYLVEEMEPSLRRLGFLGRILRNPAKIGGPFLFAERIEDPALVTVFKYGHGDVIRGQETQWRSGLNPWTLKQEGDRLYGRRESYHTKFLERGFDARMREDLVAERQLLHAWRMVLPHPGDGSPLALEAPVPEDMAAFLAERGAAPPPPGAVEGEDG